MYPHFIEVHAHQLNDKLVSINIDHIIGFCGTSRDTGIITTEDERVGQTETTETYDELKALIESSGALINMGDPRLDTKRSLTMADLKDMVGQPVWDSNTGVWLLVYDGDWMYSGDPDRVCVRMVNRYGCKDIWLSEKDLIARPLYRMKR